MNVKDFGGEFALIKKVAGGEVADGDVVVGVGDDAAVIKFSDSHHLLVTTDMLVEGDHFRLDWASPEEVGIKAMESNVSDVAAMGGQPKWAFVSIALPDGTQVETVEKIYEGMNEVCKKHGFNIVGGDTTHGAKMVINVALLGLVEKEKLCLRSGAKVGELICVTGDLGKSKAGLELLLAGKPGNRLPHLRPRSRLAESQIIAPHASSMIDVSDGLASEVGHICEMSGVGAEVEREKIPVSAETKRAAGTLKADSVDWALCGGEDFELVFTLPEENLKKINLKCPVAVVGKILRKEECAVLVGEDGQRTPLGKGFDHFK